MSKKQIILAIVVILIILGLYYGGLKDSLSLQSLKENSMYFKAMVDTNYWLSAMAFMAVYTITMMLSLPIVAPFSLLGGFLFDTLPGACFSAISTVLGSMIYVIAFRHFFYDSMQAQYAVQLAKFKENMRVYGKRYLLILHFLAITPFFMINTLCALADLSLWDVCWTTLVGSGPIFLLLSYEGRQLAHIQSVRDIFTPEFVGALGLLIVLACMPMIIQWARSLFNRK